MRDHPKATTNRALARADALGDTTLDKITGTRLDTGVQMDALAKLPEPARVELIERCLLPVTKGVGGFPTILQRRQILHRKRYQLLPITRAVQA